MANRRFTRLTDGFSKQLENLCYMIAITMIYYNFCHKHLPRRKDSGDGGRPDEPRMVRE